MWLEYFLARKKVAILQQMLALVCGLSFSYQYGSGRLRKSIYNKLFKPGFSNEGLSGRVITHPNGGPA